MDENKTNDRLFNEFPPVSTEAWEEKIKADLKGADYDKKLMWNTDEGFKVKPYYRSEDLLGLEYLNTIPGTNPYVRGVRKKDNKWIIRQDILTDNFEEANAIARDAVLKGADAIGLCAKDIATHKDMNRLLEGIDITKTGIHFIASRSYPLTLELFIYELNHRGTDGKTVHGSLNFDAAGYLLLKGDFYQSKQSNFDEAAYLLNTIEKHKLNFRAININGQFFADAGSTIIQEVAFSLASGNEYLYELTKKGIDIDLLTPRMQFTFSVGSNYFMEIAKLRAARMLWSQVVSNYSPSKTESMKMFIHSVTSTRNKTIFDPYVNMLRTTTEGMSAAIGNTDSLTIQPFDVTFREDDEFSRRIARNQQLILKEEAYLDKVVDPSAGSYFIENLTHSIATHAWDLFKQLEEKGGFIECVKSGFIQDEVAASCQKKDMDIALRKTVMIGTNQYPNLLENMLDEVKKDVSAKSYEIPSTYKKLKRSRGTLAFEQLRLSTEMAVKDGAKRPSVFLLTIGNLAMRKARATFATNFFGCAGYSITDNPGFQTAKEGIEAAIASRADYIVICSSDEEYATIGPEIASAIKASLPATKVIIAGYPKDIVEILKTAGVDDFIHIRSNVLETIQKLK
ncbi:MAG TPA: methylmalonyl-CoA mutase family protein [Bacteroidales bacterium]|nr:methylmalonyl-CoA mutase family protein [Bacteroidales bacterium]